MPIRTANQRKGDRGEQLVKGLFENDPRWLPRSQDQDYGIDFEAELADPLPHGQSLRGQILKIQVKARKRLKRADNHVQVSLERSWIDYACAFRVPVILAVVEENGGLVWWLWVQEWAMLHEEQLALSSSRTLTVRIPLIQVLDAQALEHPLRAIAEGRPATAMALALRGVLEVAHGWENQEIARGLVALLGRTRFPSRDWTIRKVVDDLVRFGPGVPYWRAQQSLPVLLALIATGGDALTQEQVIRMVRREDSYSRVGLNALEQLYDTWPDHAASLDLPQAFAKAGLDEVAWYSAIRERFPARRAFGLTLLEEPDQDLTYGGFRLRLDQELRDHLMAKWPNRADSVLLDCLTRDDIPAQATGLGIA